MKIINLVAFSNDYVITETGVKNKQALATSIKRNKVSLKRVSLLNLLSNLSQNLIVNNCRKIRLFSRLQM